MIAHQKIHYNMCLNFTYVTIIYKVLVKILPKLLDSFIVFGDSTSPTFPQSLLPDFSIIRKICQR